MRLCTKPKLLTGIGFGDEPQVLDLRFLHNRNKLLSIGKYSQGYEMQICFEFGSKYKKHAGVSNGNPD